MSKAREEQGFVLIAAIVLLVVIMGLGLGLLLFTDTQQRASGREQASESAFDVAEAALNAQIGQLNASWPSTTETGPVGGSCTASSSAATNYCPTVESLKVGYPNTKPTSCPAGTPKDAWGSSNANAWTTYVREPEGTGGSTYFNSATEQGAAQYDSGPVGKLWVRSVGVAQCRMVVLVSLVSEQFRSANFPQDAVVGNWFETSNEGNKVIVNDEGEASQTGAVQMRCGGFKGTKAEIEAACEKWNKAKKQVSPLPPEYEPNLPTKAVPTSELVDMKAEAKGAGTYFASGKCPASLEATSGFPTYVEGPCELSFTGGTGNSAKSPGFLVLANGTITLNGNAEFYGTIYDVNEQASSEAVISIHGNAHVHGAVVADGNGGISFGSSKGNLEFASKAEKEIKILVGASANRNSFRVLPNSQ